VPEIKREDRIKFLTAKKGLTFLSAQVDVVEKKEPDGMDIQILIPCGPLLEDIHIAKMSVDVAAKLIAQAKKQTVLIKVIIYNPLTGIHVYFVVEEKEGGLRLNDMSFQRKRQREVIAKTPVECIVARLFTARYRWLVTLFNAEPLHQIKVTLLLNPLDLLPGPMLSEPGVSFNWVPIRVGISCCQSDLIREIEGVTKPGNIQCTIINKTTRTPVMQIDPDSTPLRKPRLVKIPQPGLFPSFKILLGIRGQACKQQPDYQDYSHEFSSNYF